jgi:hypothetical protein
MFAIYNWEEVIKKASYKLIKLKWDRNSTVGEIWCPTLGGTSTFISLYRALASYYIIILLSYYLIILLFKLSYYPII